MLSSWDILIFNWYLDYWLSGLITDSGEFGAVSYESFYLVVLSHSLSFESDVEHEIKIEARIVDYVI